MTPPDVIVVGGGPAGAVAATVLARAGARVLVLERARFPRQKMCGDTVNPGAVAILRRLGLGAVLDGGLEIEGMIVSGEPEVRVTGTYGGGARGVALTRDVLDARLIEQAAAAGAGVEEGVLAGGARLDASGTRVVGVEAGAAGSAGHTFTAAVVIAADGHFSRVARPLHLSRSAAAPRRWALGAYFEGVAGVGRHGEMHVRAGHYIGVAPVPGGLVNACLVSAETARIARPGALLAHVHGDLMLRPRFERARMAGRPTLLGPLAVEASAAGMPGLLLAGDAAGFVDPMTGDGLRFAFRGGELAAVEALRVLEHGWGDAHRRLLAARHREFGTKWQFNRALRTLASRPAAVRTAARVAAAAPALLRRAIAYAGDAG